jgi:hypothetical protein
MIKYWVIIKDLKSGQVKAWHDYNKADHHVWRNNRRFTKGASSYEVMGYYTGKYRDAIRLGESSSGLPYHTLYVQKKENHGELV